MSKTAKPAKRPAQHQPWQRRSYRSMLNTMTTIPHQHGQEHLATRLAVCDTSCIITPGCRITSSVPNSRDHSSLPVCPVACTSSAHSDVALQSYMSHITSRPPPQAATHHTLHHLQHQAQCAPCPSFLVTSNSGDSCKQGPTPPERSDPTRPVPRAASRRRRGRGPAHSHRL